MAHRTSKSAKQKSQSQNSSRLPRALFLGTWNRVNDEGVMSPYMTVTDSGATKDHPASSARSWEIVGNEARFTWVEGSQDILHLEPDGNVTLLSFGKAAGGRNERPEFKCRALRTVTPMLIRDVTTSEKPRAPSTDSRPLRTRLTEIRHDFQQIAQQAPWVSAAFVPVQGRMMLNLARKNEGKKSSLLMRGMAPGDPEAAVILELYLLTDRAGAIVSELCQAGLLNLPTVPAEAGPLLHWHALLTSKEIMQVSTCKIVADGVGVAGWQIGDWISNYAQVSATAALWLERYITEEEPSQAVAKWMPATEAVELAEESGYSIPLAWVSRDAKKHGVLVRPKQLQGNHKLEVEWNFLAVYLLEHGKRIHPAAREGEPNKTQQQEINERIKNEREKKHREHSLD
jgi:hypothetical protein